MRTNERIDRLVRAIDATNEKNAELASEMNKLYLRVDKRFAVHDVCMRQRKAIKRMKRTESTLDRIEGTLRVMQKQLLKIEGEETESDDSMSQTWDSEEELEVDQARWAKIIKASGLPPETGVPVL